MTATRPHRFRDLALTLGAVAGACCVVVALLATVLDLRLLTFRSGSMSPSIRTGALGVARTVPAVDLRVGDVVSVPTSGGDRVTHRIVAIDVAGSQAALELRGDANEVSDAAPYVVAQADRIWFSVPLVGYVAGALASPFGLVLLALYAGYLLRVLLRRRRPGETPGPPRHRRTTARTGAVAVVLVGVAASGTGVVALRSSSTLAAWADGVGTTGSTFATTTVAAPATFTCGVLGLFSVTFNWSAAPGATSYTLHYGAGGSQTRSVTGTSATITAVISGGTAWVTAERDYGATTWTSAPSVTRGYSVIAVSLCG